MFSSRALGNICETSNADDIGQTVRSSPIADISIQIDYMLGNYYAGEFI